MHVHLAGPAEATVAQRWSVPLIVAHGITGVRSMFDDFALVRNLRHDISAGKMIGPRIIASGPIVDGPNPIWPGSISVSTPEEGRAAVHQLKAIGTDFVKVYDRLPREAYFAIMEEARREGIVVAGHVPASVTAAQVSDAGQKSIEHVQLLLVSCSTRESELNKLASSLRAAFQAVDSFDNAKAADLLRKFVANGTWVTPTLVYSSHFLQENYRNDPRWPSTPAALRPFWESSWAVVHGNTDVAVRRRLTDRTLQLVHDMQQAGVKILAGTDILNPYVYPGSALHDELELLVKAGLSPTLALQAATVRPAEYLGMMGRLGTIETGKLADLVLLDGDPLENISNTRRIAAVVLNGKLQTKSELDRMVAAIVNGQ
jgi:imidazolonepropionase-like amidohydrolase